MLTLVVNEEEGHLPYQDSEIDRDEHVPDPLQAGDRQRQTRKGDQGPVDTTPFA